MNLEEKLKECKQALECCKRQFEQVKKDYAECKQQLADYRTGYAERNTQLIHSQRENERLRGIIEEIQKKAKESIESECKSVHGELLLFIESLEEGVKE